MVGNKHKHSHDFTVEYKFYSKGFIPFFVHEFLKFIAPQLYRVECVPKVERPGEQKSVPLN